MRAVVLAAAMGILVACSGHSSLRHADTGDRFSGMASWYGHPFHGRRTASGEVFDMHARTAAHRSLPFGTRLKVTSVDTGRSTLVTVNDRGPFIRGRHLDLSYAAAQEIGLVRNGVGRVTAHILGRDDRYRTYINDESPSLEAAPAGFEFALQFGSFLDRDNAARLKRALDLTSSGARITQGVVDGKLYYRVRLGRFHSPSVARDRARAFAEEGYTVLIVRDASPPRPPR